MVQLGKKLQVQICKKNTIFVFNHKINKMSKELKITEVELKELQEQEQKKGAILHDLGLLEVQKLEISQEVIDYNVSSGHLNPVINIIKGDIFTHTTTEKYDLIIIDTI